MQLVPDEQQIVALAQKGNEEAVTFLYETHVDSIFGYISYRVASVEVAEDLTSEVFLRMLRGLPNYQDQGVPFRAWLFRIAANLLTDHYRQKGKNALTPIPEDYQSNDLDPLDEATSKEETLRLRHALRVEDLDWTRDGSGSDSEERGFPGEKGRRIAAPANRAVTGAPAQTAAHEIVSELRAHARAPGGGRIARIRQAPRTARTAPAGCATSSTSARMTRPVRWNSKSTAAPVPASAPWL